MFSMLRDVLKNRPNVHVVKLQNQVVFYLGIQKFDKRPEVIRSGRFFMSTEEHGIFNDLHVYRIGGGPQAPRSALPIGADLVANPLRLVAVTSDQVQELIHLVLAVSYAEEPD
ncbi:hypothetical protein ACOSP7_027231 [Xanthoceras sorbifolium]